MIKRLIHCTILLTIALCLSEGVAQAQTSITNVDESTKAATDTVGLRFFDLLAQRRPSRQAAFALMAQPGYANASGRAFSISPMAVGPNLPVMGGGTLGRLTKWTGFTSSNSFIGDSTIFESKLGNVGIGTDSPTSRLTVAGVIQSTIGGFRFPDGTAQTTAGITSIPVPLVLTGAVSSGGIIQATNTALSGRGIDASGGIGGDGVRARGGNSSTFGGDGLLAVGGFSSVGNPGTGVRAAGGDSEIANGGFGLGATGGRSDVGAGGTGVTAVGGLSDVGFGGGGVSARGGLSNSATGGTGVHSAGGDGSNGGKGVVVLGGSGNGAGHSGGIGIEATGGIGLNGASHGLAGKFFGDVEIGGNLSVNGTKNFKIDHPLDPENKYLVHAAVESAEVLNVYSGNVTTNGQGEAVVRLPDWFEAINRDLRYQLTVIGTFAQAIVGAEVQHNRFTIKTNAPNVKVSWQVTGVRSDAAMKRHPFKLEPEKPERERGTYLNPEAYGQPEERGVEWARHPQLMRQVKPQRSEAGQKHKPNNR